MAPKEHKKQFFSILCMCLNAGVGARVCVTVDMGTGQCTAISGKGWTWSVGSVCLEHIPTQVEAN